MTYDRLCSLKVLSLFLLSITLSAAAAAQSLPPKKAQPTPEKVVAEHTAAVNACDWNRVMAQYDDDMVFLRKDGNVVRGRAAIGKMFQQSLKDPSEGGQCGRKLTPEHIYVVGNTVNVVWRVEAPFFEGTYYASEAFETKNGLLAAQVSTWDLNGVKMKK